MSVFPKNIFLKIVREAILSECITIQSARLVCKAVLNDFEIRNWFNELYRVMSTWNRLRDMSLHMHQIYIKTRKGQPYWFRCGRCKRELFPMEIRRSGTNKIEFSLARIYPHFRYTIVCHYPNYFESISVVSNGRDFSRKRPRK